MAKKKAARPQPVTLDGDPTDFPIPGEIPPEPLDQHTEPEGPVSFKKDASIWTIMSKLRGKKGEVASQFIDGLAAQEREIGIALPSLAARYLFTSDAYLLQKMVMILGPGGSNKSAFMHEVMRWHYVAGGFCSLVHTENKDQAGLRAGLWLHFQQWLQEFFYVPALSTEGAQKAMTAMSHVLKEFYAQEGYSRPHCMGLDSLAARSSDKVQENILDKGSAAEAGGYSDAKNAGLIALYMRSMASFFEDMPFSWVVVNHIGMGMPESPTAFAKKTTPGGRLQKYQEGVELELTASKQLDRKVGKTLFTGHKVRFSHNKNAWGPKQVPIEVDFMWWWEKDPTRPGEYRQFHIWDWHGAVPRIWEALEANRPPVWEALKEACDCVKQRGGLYSSKRLGVQKVSAAEFSMALEQRPDVLTDIYPILSISKHTIMGPGQDFRKLLNQEEAKQECLAWQRYKDCSMVMNVGEDAEDTAAE